MSMCCCYVLKGNIMKKGEAKNNAKPSKAKNDEDDGDGDDFKVLALALLFSLV